MSGPIGSSQWMYSSAAGFYPYSIGQSLRFDGSSAYLNFTPSSSTTATVTISFWVKRSKLGATQYLFASGAANARGNIGFNSSDQLFFQGFNSSGANSVLTSSMLFRDVSSWYHIVVECDGVTTTSNFPTNTNVYVNGSTISMTHSTASSPSGGFRINDTQVKHIGALTPTASSYLSGYMAEVHWIDGTALDATSFGETINGVWVPKEYTGSHGSAGYYLPFDDSSAIGDDESGNTNDWTANNLAASDVMSGESPTNNFCTLNPLAYTNGITLSDGNLTMATTTNNRAVHGTIALPSSGKWYVELHVDSYASGGGTQFGWCTDASLGYDEYSQSKGVFFSTYNQAVTIDNSAGGGNYNTQGNNSSSNGDIYQLLLDVDNKVFYIGKNGTYRNSADPGNGTGGLDVTSMFTNAVTDIVFSATRGGSYNETYSINFGQDSKDVSSANADDNGIGTFEYAPPSGFLALCSANLPEPTISPNSTEQADDYFNTLLYTGDGTTSRSITGVGFAPDFVWGKCRSNAEDHILSDTVRGANKKLESNNTGAEDTSTAATLSGFESDGFTGPSSTPGNINVNGRTYVAWNWKAGGTAVSNTDGSITSSVSAAPDAGFAICTYTGNGAAGATVGHGLGKKPTMIIVKNRDSGVQDWPVQHGSIGATGQMVLSSTAANNANIVYWNNTEPTSSVFSLGTSNNTNQSGNSHVAYVFTDIDGFSKAGSYVGNGNADGTFVFTGFRPAWVMTKPSSTTGNWIILDAERNTFNVTDKRLYPDSSAVEATVTAHDFLSNGFKVRNTGNPNDSGATYIYLAFAEAPFKYANAR